MADQHARTLGECLLLARRRAGLTQKATAKRLGVSRPRLSRWEGDLATPNITEFAGLVTIYDAEWMWEWLGENPEN